MNRAEISANLVTHWSTSALNWGSAPSIAPRISRPPEDYVFERFQQMGYDPRRQSYTCLGQEVSNVVAGEPDSGGYYILGAHFDTVAGTPGADDNASGVAVLLETARLARSLKPARPWTFIGFTCEEPPVFFSPHMGSGSMPDRRVNGATASWACSAWRWWAINSQEPGSQELPLSLRLLGYPTTGNFLGLVSNWTSRGFAASPGGRHQTRWRPAHGQPCRALDGQYLLPRPASATMPASGTKVTPR